MDGARDSKPVGAFARARSALIARLLQVALVRAALLYSGRRGPMLADAVTYRALFSVFAAVLLGFSAAALWLSGDDQAWGAIVSAVDAAVPGLLKNASGDGIVDVEALREPVGLSIAGVISLLGLIGSALGAIGALRTALRVMAGTLAQDAAWFMVLLRNLLLAVLIGGVFAAAAGLTFASELIMGLLADALSLPRDSGAVFWVVQVLSLLIVFALDATLIAAAFRVLSGLRVARRDLWAGAALGAVALVVLQELSGLFVGGARANPLLATFASLLALLLWLNLSTQVILLASALIVVLHARRHDRVSARHSVTTLAEHARHLAEQDVRAATASLRAAQESVEQERAAD